jgi:hypothetical protein
METLPRTPRFRKPENSHGFVRLRRNIWHLLRNEAHDRELTMGELVEDMLRALPKAVAKRGA